MTLEMVRRIMMAIDDDTNDVILALDQEDFDEILRDWPLMARITGHRMEARQVGKINGMEAAGLIFDGKGVTIMAAM